MSTDQPFVAPTDRRVVEVTGEERTGYLEDVTSQHLTDLEPGGVRGALYLETHGSPVAMFDVVVLPERLLLVVADDEQAEEVVESLGGKTFLRDASFAATDLRVAALRGQGGAAACEHAGLLDAGRLIDQPGRAEVLGADTSGGDEAHGRLMAVGRGGGVDLLADPQALDQAVDRLLEAGAAEGTAEDLEVWRVRAGEPAWGREVTAPHLPEEIGLLPTHVHLEKGCYPGQEAIARMWNLGRPRRRLARVRTTPAVDAGATLGSGRDKVRVTSVADGGNGRVDALAFVPAGSDAGDELVADDVAVEVLEIVGADQPVPGRDPSRTRRRDQD